MDREDITRLRKALRSTLDRRRAIGGAIVGTFAWLTAPSKAPARSAKQPFAADFAGSFAISEESEDSPIFAVDESGTGNDALLGDFTYTSMVRQNLARVPAGCGPNSSTGAGGAAVLSFADGELHLLRKEGTSCFAFPYVTIEERWTVADGTERYSGASGKLARLATGDVRFGTIQGTWDGTLKLVGRRKR